MNTLDLEKPLIGLAPMDGVTDASYRYIQKKYGNPNVTFTEFTNVIGLRRGAEKLFQDLEYSAIEAPIIAQVFGNDPESYYHSAKIIAALGFDGIDINMGCPARNVAEKGSGAGLILNPELAKEIARQTRKGVEDFSQTRELTGLNSKAEKLVDQAIAKLDITPDYDKSLPDFTFSIKTRIGYSENIVSEWIKHLEEVEPDWISLHGRTLKQLYSGDANWEAIAQAVESTQIPILGNGDIKSSNDAVKMLSETGAAGLLIGRASYGNPWIFKRMSQIKEMKSNIEEYRPTPQEVINVMLEHSDLHWEKKGEKGFVQMRKNLAWYIKGFEGAAELRAKLVRVNSPQEVRETIQTMLSAKRPA